MKTYAQMTPREREEAREWRASEFVVSYPYTGDRGRMRGSSYHAPATLHRPSCRFMSVDYRVDAYSPADVFEETIEKWNEGVKRSGSYTGHKVCKVCCPDLVGKVYSSDGNGKVFAPGEVLPTKAPGVMETWKDVQKEMAKVLEVPVENIYHSKSYDGRHWYNISEAQARRLIVLARKGLEAQS